MHRFCQIAIAAYFLTVHSSSSFSAERKFDFSAAVALTFGDPFGKSIDPAGTVTGSFLYETNSAATHSVAGCVDCAGYEQQHFNGFRASFSGLGGAEDVLVRADDYVVEIANDAFDSVTIAWRGNFAPALAEDLQVDAVAQTEGIFQILFVASSNGLFADSSLPGDLNPADFFLPSMGNSLSDSFPGALDVLFNVTSFNSVTTLSSDHDLDGDVDGDDLSIWRSHYGNFSRTNHNGDADSNGWVNGIDFLDWQSNHGISPALLAVPEPSSRSAMLLLAILFMSRLAVSRQR